MLRELLKYTPKLTIVFVKEKNFPAVGLSLIYFRA